MELPNTNTNGNFFNLGLPKIGSSNLGASMGGYTDTDLSGFDASVGNNGVTGATGGGSPGFSWFGGTDANGVTTNSGLGMGLNAGLGAFNSWLGYKKLGIAKDQLKENKRQFNMNWGAQKKTVNNQLFNAQQSRNNSIDPNKNVDMGEYMAKWGIE